MAELSDALLQELMKSFNAEAGDHLQLLNQSLLEIEREPPPEQAKTLIQDAFRAAHSLKGAARAVSMKQVEALSHAMEAVLHLARDEGYVLTPDVCDVFYDTLDAIGDVIDGKTVDSEPLLVRLRSLLPGDASDSAAPPPVESASSANGKHHHNGADTDSADDPAPSSGGGTVEETIRVSVSKLDDVMAQVSELLVARISAEHRLTNAHDVRYHLGNITKGIREIQAFAHRLPADQSRQLTETVDRHGEIIQHLIQSFDVLDRGIYQDSLQLGVAADGLQDQIRRMRMVPFQTITLMLERAVRDVARTEDKHIAFAIEGAGVELDKRVLELLKDPLLHLLRNAVSHGIEAPDQREAAGKPSTGTINLRVSQRGSEVKITVDDDGHGFDIERLRQAAGRVQENDELLGSNDVINWAFLPGVSTADHVTEISGRGVGLDVVRRQVEAMQGRIGVDNRPGHGVTFTLTVPTSLAMTRVLVVTAQDVNYALPLLAVEKILDAENTFMSGGRPMLKVDGVTLPLVSLASLLELNMDGAIERPLVIVMGVAEQRIGLMVDDVVTEQELAVKTLQKPLTRIRNISGAALMGNGDPIVVLNPVDMIRASQNTHMPLPQLQIRQDATDAEETPAVHVLVVDDSITTRTLEKNILEAAGFNVTTATDGVQAMQRLKGASVDIIVSDIEMPNMNGFDLVTTVRETADLQHLPIILVTSLESREDREMGMRVGADAYIVKRGFDQAELLATIQQLI